MKPRNNAKLSHKQRAKIEQLLGIAVEAKRQAEADDDEAQPDDSGRKVPPERISDPRREFPKDKVFYPNYGTYEYPLPPTEEQLAMMRELAEVPRATMGRTRSNRL